MKQFYFLFFLLISFKGFSQCGNNSSFFFSSQAQIDNFPIEYPDCTDADVINVTGDDITNLQGLYQLTSLRILNFTNNPILETLDGLNPNLLITEEGYFQITGNPILNDISVLASQNAWTNLTLVFIADNPSLTSLNGLEVLQGHHDSVAISDNDALTDLSGLQNLNSADRFDIGSNDALITLDGLNEYLQTSNLTISNNPNLTDINALNYAIIQITPTTRLSINNNANLSLCSAFAICNAIDNWSPTVSYTYLNITNNAPGCGSVSQVSYNCNLIPNNDDCVGAYPVYIGMPFDAYTLNGSPSTQASSCNDNNGVDVWFTFNSANLNLMNITIGEDYSAQLWEGSCTGLTHVANACASNMLSDVVVTPNTDYYLQVWPNGMATGLFDVLVEDATLSVGENSFEGFSVYPNPLNNKLNLKSVHAITSVEIYNFIGQSVMTTQPNTLVTSLDLSSFHSGMYVLKVKIGNQTRTFRIMKE